MAPQVVGMDELVEHWSVLEEGQELLAGKRGASRLGFALLLKCYTRHGRFPRGRAEFGDEVVAFVARQVNVATTEIAFYEWSGRVRAELLKHCFAERIEPPAPDRIMRMVCSQASCRSVLPAVGGPCRGRSCSDLVATVIAGQFSRSLFFATPAGRRRRGPRRRR